MQETQRSAGFLSGEGGIRTPREFSEKTALSPEGGAESDAPIATDPHLTLLLTAWPTLPDPIRAGILALVRAAGG